MIRSLLNRVMSPGIHFMRRWTLAARFGLLSGAASLMVVLLSVYGGVQSVSAWRGTRLEVEGVAQVDALTTLSYRLHLLHSAWQQSVVAADAAESKTALREAAARLQQAIATVDALPDFQQQRDLKPAWATLHATLTATLQSAQRTGTFPSARDISAQTGALRRLILLTGETSTLLLDPEAEAFHLMLVLVDRFPPMLDTLTLLRAQAIGSGEPSTEVHKDNTELAALRKLLQKQSDDITHAFDALQRAGKPGASAWVTTAGVFGGYAAQIERLSGNMAGCAGLVPAWRGGAGHGHGVQPVDPGSLVDELGRAHQIPADRDCGLCDGRRLHGVDHGLPDDGDARGADHLHGGHDWHHR